MALRMRSYLMAALPQLRIEQTPRRVRVLHGGTTVADTTEALLVWEPRRLVPTYAVPESTFGARLSPDPDGDKPVLDDLPPVLGPGTFKPHTTPGESLTVHVDGDALPGAAFRAEDPDLAGYLVLEFARFDWMEEGERLVGHPHDPFKRIDTLGSSRHVVVSLDGTVLADTRRAVALLETGLPVRWYLPRQDVRMDLLSPSERVTTCAYKGHASYFSVPAAGANGQDVAWTYTEPLQDAIPVGTMVCFFSERTDLSIDGVAVARPVTPWSRPEEQRALFERAADISSLEFG